MEFDRFADPEAYRLGKQIDRELRPYWPPELAELRFKSGLDHTGDPGLWIWVFLTEEISREDKTFLEAATRLRGSSTRLPDASPLSLALPLVPPDR